jgi:hypothetical protein
MINPNASAGAGMTPMELLRSPSPATVALISKRQLPGSPFPIAVAKRVMKTSGRMRPHASANVAVMPTPRMRSPSPATIALISKRQLPGSPIRIAVATPNSWRRYEV